MIKIDLRTILFLILLVLPNVSLSQNFWQQTNGPYGPGYVTAINAQSDGNIYVAIDKAGLYRSSDYGKSFSYVSKDLSNTSIRTLLVNSSDHIFVGILANPYAGLYRSTNAGDTWIQELSSEYVRSMTIDVDGFIYAETNESGIFRSSAGDYSSVKKMILLK